MSQSFTSLRNLAADGRGHVSYSLYPVVRPAPYDDFARSQHFFQPEMALNMSFSSCPTASGHRQQFSPGQGSFPYRPPSVCDFDQLPTALHSSERAYVASAPMMGLPYPGYRTAFVPSSSMNDRMLSPGGVPFVSTDFTMPLTFARSNVGVSPPGVAPQLVIEPEVLSDVDSSELDQYLDHRRGSFDDRPAEIKIENLDSGDISGESTSERRCGIERVATSSDFHAAAKPETPSPLLTSERVKTAMDSGDVTVKVEKTEHSWKENSRADYDVTNGSSGQLGMAFVADIGDLLLVGNMPMPGVEGQPEDDLKWNTAGERDAQTAKDRAPKGEGNQQRTTYADCAATSHQASVNVVGMSPRSFATTGLNDELFGDVDGNALPSDADEYNFVTSDDVSFGELRSTSADN
jgi:hypothetical protein